jgi:hypothetical protein
MLFITMFLARSKPGPIPSSIKRRGCLTSISWWSWMNNRTPRLRSSSTSISRRASHNSLQWMTIPQKQCNNGVCGTSSRKCTCTSVIPVVLAKFYAKTTMATFIPFVPSAFQKRTQNRQFFHVCFLFRIFNSFIRIFVYYSRKIHRLHSSSTKRRYA